METIELSTTGRRTTRLGYGCSSLMGAMGHRDSVALLEAAFDAGVRHFDVAPMYGFGQAESCVGEFAARHRGHVTVTTKFGIAPPKRQGLVSVARSVARPVLRALPGLKKGMLQVASRTAAPAARAKFSVAEAQASLERSLKELRTERVDVWLLHEATVDDLKDDGLLRMLEDAVAAGKIGAFGVGSERARAERLMAERPEYCPVAQFEWSVMDETVGETASFRIHHRALTDNFRSLHAALAGDAAKASRWSTEVGADLRDRHVLAALMLKAALVENPGSVVLFSSKSVQHMQRNAATAEAGELAEPARRLYALVRRELDGVKAAMAVAG
ncbi:MAG TPA: aldo/keto reductase [Acidobacteriaceae bacterium]|nr:aldo/keto reductase [Acidobacteriaceae bacterium]